MNDGTALAIGVAIGMSSAHAAGCDGELDGGELCSALGPLVLVAVAAIALPFVVVWASFIWDDHKHEMARRRAERRARRKGSRNDR